MTGAEVPTWVDSLGNVGFLGVVLMGVRWLVVSGWGARIGELIVAWKTMAEKHIEHLDAEAEHRKIQRDHMQKLELKMDAAAAAIAPLPNGGVQVYPQ